MDDPRLETLDVSFLQIPGVSLQHSSVLLPDLGYDLCLNVFCKQHIILERSDEMDDFIILGGMDGRDVLEIAHHHCPIIGMVTIGTGTDQAALFHVVVFKSWLLVLNLRGMVAHILVK